MTLVQAINQALDQEMARDDRVVLLGEDVGINGGVFRVTEGLAEKHGTHRVQNTPLDESGILGAAIGLAMAGMRPIPEIQFEGFLGPAYDQIVNHAARFRNRTRGAITIPMTVRVPVGGGIHAPELHSDSPEAIYSHSPGLKVVMPCTPYDAKGLLLSAIRDPDPVIFFEPKRVYRSFREEVPEDDYTIPIGEAKVVNEGDRPDRRHLGRLGLPVPRSDRRPARRRLGRADRPADHRPAGHRLHHRERQKTGRCVIVHEAPKTAGMGAEISDPDPGAVLPAPRGPRAAGRGLRHDHALLQAGTGVPARRERIGSAIGEVLAY
jgi:pyruvate/2-oxoglutarate/acetoin dehydrogenase E1 component